jgi:hypothetical protein
MTHRYHDRDEPYPLNRTQKLTLRWLHRSGLAGDDLLMEALYRRGFLAYRDEQGVWLGTGSHEADLEVLRRINGISVEPVSGDKQRMARVRLIENEAAPMAVAEAIVSLPENKGRMTSAGIAPDFYGPFYATWDSYRGMLWGAKRPTCPMTENDRGATRIHNALDLGIALFVKVLPLARVGTSLSCDGHGKQPAYILFTFDWDAAWSNAVFDALRVARPNTVWFVKDRDLYIVPSCAADEFAKGFSLEETDFNDAQVLGMLDDIQRVSRRLLDQDTIDRISRARARTLATFRTSPPDVYRFAAEARRQLEVEFGFAPSGPTHPHWRHQATTDL